MKNRIVKKRTNWVVMIAILAGLAVGAGSCGQGAAPSDTGVYNAEAYDIPWGLALNKDGSTLYAANYLRDNISVYDTSSMTVKYKISTLCKPLYMTFNSDYSLIYLTHDNQSNCTKSQTSSSIITTGAYISVIDVSLKKVIKEIPITTVSFALRDIVYDSNHNVLYALTSTGGKIAIIDAGSNTLANTITYDTSTFKPMRIKYDSVENILYIVDIEKGNIDISTPVDPLNLEFRKIGYNKYNDGYCLGTSQRDGCPCKNKDDTASCKSGVCDAAHTFPYCGSVECTATSYKGEAGSEKNCTQTVTTTTDCDDVVDGLSCLGTMSAGVCQMTTTETLISGACATNNACTTALGAGYTCNLTSGKCEKNIYIDEVCSSSIACAGWSEYITTACPSGDSDCSISSVPESIAAKCGDSGYCQWYVQLSSEECTGLPSTCNTTTGKCDMSFYTNNLCDTADGYACDTTDGICRKTVYDDSKCDAALEQTCNTSSGTCASTVYKDSLCDLEGYLCDRGDGICKIDRYPNGCSCDYDTECVGNEKSTDFCDDNDGICKTYSSINISSIIGFCDMRYNDCYDKATAPKYNDEVSKITVCSKPTDILLLSDNTAYVACYGASSGNGHTDKDPLYRIVMNDDSIAHDGQVLVTFKSDTLCDKPFKMVKDPSEKTALVLCSGSNVVYALDIETGVEIKTFDTPDNATDIVISSDYFYVSGTTSDKITKYPIPFM